MTSDEWAQSRFTLARTMLNALPRFGQWADTMREFNTPFGTIGYRQASILWVLRYELIPRSEMTPTGFATFFRVQPSVVTRALAKLEHGEFIVRSIDSHDTRVSHIAISPKGTEISVYIEQLYIDDLMQALCSVPDEDIEALHQSVDTLATVADRLELLHVQRTRRASTSARCED